MSHHLRVMGQICRTSLKLKPKAAYSYKAFLWPLEQKAANFLLQGQRVTILGLAIHVVSVANRLCPYR